MELLPFSIRLFLPIELVLDTLPCLLFFQVREFDSVNETQVGGNIHEKLAER